MKTEEKKRGILGGIILITLGILMIMSSSGIYGFDKSWPLLFMVISISILVQRFSDFAAWVIGAAGLGFFVMENFYAEVQNWGKYVFPLLLIVLGSYILFKRGRGTRD